jgi:membrane-associated phospholipid phosphatase
VKPIVMVTRTIASSTISATGNHDVGWSTVSGVVPPNSSALGRRQLSAWWAEGKRVDVAVYEAILRTPTPSLDRGMSRLTQAANYSRLWLGSAAILAVTRGGRGRRAAVVGLASVAATSAVANLVVKPLGRRRRPDSSAAPADRRAPMPASSSFPSGHAASAFAFATGVGTVLPGDSIPIRALATVVAYSRVHTGVHYPADVIAGGFLGTTLAQLTTRALDRWLDPPVRDARGRVRPPRTHAGASTASLI